jgi:hypothetical protein
MEKIMQMTDEKANKSNFDVSKRKDSFQASMTTFHCQNQLQKRIEWIQRLLNLFYQSSTQSQ